MKNDKFYKFIFFVLADLQEKIREQKNDFNLNEFFLMIGDNLEKNDISMLVTIFSHRKDSVTIRYLNDCNEDKRIRKAFDYFFLDVKIMVEKNNYLTKYYLINKAQYIPERQKDIYRTYPDAKKYLKKYSFNSIICPIEMNGQIIGFFEFFSPKINNKHLELFDNFVKEAVRNLYNFILFDELKVSEEKFKDIFENGELGFYILNGRKKKFVEVNEALVEISGHTKNELLEMNYINFFSKEERKRIDKYVKTRLEKKDSLNSPQNYETKILCKNGQEKHIKLNISRYINNDEWFVIIIDITGRKKAEKKLLKAHENQNILNNLLLISLEDIILDKKIQKLLNVFAGSYWEKGNLSIGGWLLPDEGSKKITFFSSKNFPPEQLKICKTNSFNLDKYESAILNKKIETYEGKRKKELKRTHSPAIINSCFVPLMYEDLALGAVQFLFKKKKAISSEELDFFKAVANIFSSVIEREKNIIELEKNEEKYRDLINNAGDMFVLLSLEGEILFANQSFYSSFKKSTKNKAKFKNIIHEESSEQFDTEFNAFLKSAKEVKIEFRVSGINKIIYAEAKFTSIVKNGKKNSVQAIIRDITETKKAEQKIHETKKHYISVIDTIRDGIFVIDKNFNIISYNKFFAEKVGLPVGMIKNKKCSSILPRYENNLFINELKKKENISFFLKKVFSLQGHMTIERKVIYESNDFYYKISISPTKNKDNNVYQIVVTISNISKNREAEEEIRKLDEFKNRVLNNVPVSIAMLDKSGKIISLNDYAQKLIGRELLGKKLVLTKEIINNKKLISLYENLLKNGKSFKFENLVYTKGKRNEKKYLNLIAAPLFDALGKVEGAISIAVDNTESKIHREKIENLNQNLEKKVKSRTLELDTANKKLNRALDLKLKFISDASHELRTPLTIMKGNLDLLFFDKKNKDENILEVYKDIEEEIGRMSDIIADLTMLTNADSEMEKFYYQKVDIIKLLEAVIKSLSIIAREKNISLELEKSPKKIFIKGDVSKMDKVFMNLIRNAIKYTNKNGKVKIFLNINKKNIDITISDNGIGMPQKELTNIFERFYRLDKARSRAEGGTGLGLSICKWIVEAHNGTISVKSEEGVGSDFTVKIPCN